MLSILKSAFYLAAIAGSGVQSQLVQNCGDQNAVMTLTSNSTNTSLLAGQNIDVGSTIVELDGNQISVQQQVNDPWSIDQAHLWVGKSIEGYPQTRKGNPKIGVFPYKKEDVNAQSVSFNNVYQIEEDICQFCDGQVPDPVYMLAHASVVEKAEDGGIISSETAWASGYPVVDKGSWATRVTLEFDVDCANSNPTPPPTPSGEGCQTSFSKSLSASKCFLNIDEDNDGIGDYNRWGWTNGPMLPGIYTLNIYAAAGQCDLNKGTLVGQMDLDYDGNEATVTIRPMNGFSMEENHIYVGSEILPRNVNQEYTVAPGQYPEVHEFEATTSEKVYVFSGLNNVGIHVVAHGVFCGSY